MSELFIKRDGKISGPHTREQVEKAIKAGKFRDSDRIARSKDGPWSRLPSHNSIDQASASATPTETDKSPDQQHTPEDQYLSEESYDYYDVEDFDSLAFDEELTAPKHQRASSRFKDLAGDVVEEFVPGRGIPRDVGRLIPKDEIWYLATRPSRGALWIGLGCAASPFTLWFLFSSIRWFFLAGGELPSNWPIFMSKWLLYCVVGLGIPCYLALIRWRNQFYGITSQQLVQRSGWFNHTISCVPTANVQFVSINTGLIDRLLGLNSVVFATAAASGFKWFNLGILNFSNVHTEEVMRAYSKSLGRTRA